MSKLDKIASAYHLSNDAINYHEEDYIAPSMYADPINKRYPIHTKEACELSMAEYMYDNINDEDIHVRLVKSATAHGIVWPTPKAKPALTKVSAMDNGDILEVEFANTPEGISKAMDAVLEFRKTASYIPCMELAKGVVKEAFKHDCDIPDAIMQLAGYCAGTKEAALNAISKRAYSNKNSEVSDKMQQLMNQVLETPGDIIPHDDLTKIAEVLDAYDGLREDRGYTTYNIPPEQELFNKTAFDLVTDLEDEMEIPSVGAVVSKKDITKNASVIMPILNEMGITCEEKDLPDTVAKLNEKQANYLFGDLNV